MWPIKVDGLIKVYVLYISLLLFNSKYSFFCFLFLNSVLFLSASLSPACIGEPAGSTLVLRQDEAVQTTRPGVPEGSAQTGALSVQQGKSS